LRRKRLSAGSGPILLDDHGQPAHDADPAQQGAGGTYRRTGAVHHAGRTASGLSIERPSSQFHVFRQADGVYQLDQPDNWDAYVASGGYGVTIVPRGGFTNASNGRQDISYGVIVNHYVPFDGAFGTAFVDPNGSMYGRTSLEEATADLVRNILASDSCLRQVGNTTESRVMAGIPPSPLNWWAARPIRAPTSACDRDRAPAPG
jgi:hypothetical protein